MQASFFTDRNSNAHLPQSKWWKCALQVNTPEWGEFFKLPSGSTYNFEDEYDRARFLDEYMMRIQQAGIEAIVLADHNSGNWIDEAKIAGQKHNVIVFPGCEITTSSGSDGVHIIIVGDLDKTSRDFDRLIHNQLGFNDDYPAVINEAGRKKPGASSRTVIQILDDLPEGYLAFAPHALTENGIASGDTVKGTIRGKALHHERLIAMDVGDCDNPQGTGFNDKFRRRELDYFPCLRYMPFISAGDCYSFDNIGNSFTWIRMAKPSLEALRQACLDHESRIICDWSSRLSNFPNQDPNRVRHAWVESIELQRLSNSTDAPLKIKFHPHFNVIIGGRGSGKSTIVSALRQLYSSNESLPNRLKEEANDFVNSVFGQSFFRSKHRLQESQDLIEVEWRLSSGSEAVINDQHLPVNFSVAVINQKELFERVAGDRKNVSLSSQSLWSLVDESIGFRKMDAGVIDSFERRIEDARSIWEATQKTAIQMSKDSAQLPILEQQISILQRQIEAFTAPEVQQRIIRINTRYQEFSKLSKLSDDFSSLIYEAKSFHNKLTQSALQDINVSNDFKADLDRLRDILNTGLTSLISSLAQGITTAEQALTSFNDEKIKSSWYKDYLDANEDNVAYHKELESMGLSATEYTRLQEEHSRISQLIQRLRAQEPLLVKANLDSSTAWQNILDIYNERRTARQNLLNDIQIQSGRIRFNVKHFANTDVWIDAIRSLAGMRVDAFLEDVPALATWLWSEELVEMNNKWIQWRSALANGAMNNLQASSNMRPAFAERLGNLDEAVRFRIASLVPDDIITMEFLREGGNPAENRDWQSVAQGSPGQRTAAMLAFVLHHGKEPLILDQPEDDLDSEWISELVVKELRKSRWSRQLIVISHNANIPVLGDADQVITLENLQGQLKIRETNAVTEDGIPYHRQHIGPIENELVRVDIQSIMEGGVIAFVTREQKYNNETRLHKYYSNYSESE